MRFSMFRPALVILLGLSGAAMAQDAANAAAQQQAPAPAAPATTAPVDATATTPAPADAATAPPAADAAPAAANGVISAPPAGKGQIVFFREKKFTGAAIRFKVREGDTELGKLSNGVYFVVPVDPGTHTYTVHSEAKDVLTLEVEAGETYYVKGSVSMGFLAGHPNLSPSDEASFDTLANKLERTQ
jgi:hypothetical protein